MRAIVASACISLALCACATWNSEPKKPTAQIPAATASAAARENSGEYLNCDWEHEVGTNIRRRFCWDDESLASTRHVTQTWMDYYMKNMNMQRGN